MSRHKWGQNILMGCFVLLMGTRGSFAQAVSYPVETPPRGNVSVRPVAPHLPFSPVEIRFPATVTTLSAEDRQVLMGVADQMRQTPTIRLWIRAWAQGMTVGNTSARRISLEQALAVRSFLETQGISAFRLLIQPMGDRWEENETEKTNRVVLSLFSP